MALPVEDGVAYYRVISIRRASGAQEKALIVERVNKPIDPPSSP